jgi:hypothetical protein
MEFIFLIMLGYALYLFNGWMDRRDARKFVKKITGKDLNI